MAIIAVADYASVIAEADALGFRTFGNKADPFRIEHFIPAKKQLRPLSRFFQQIGQRGN